MVKICYNTGSVLASSRRIARTRSCAPAHSAANISESLLSASSLQANIRGISSLRPGSSESVHLQVSAMAVNSQEAIIGAMFDDIHDQFICMEGMLGEAMLEVEAWSHGSPVPCEQNRADYRKKYPAHAALLLEILSDASCRKRVFKPIVTDMSFVFAL